MDYFMESSFAAEHDEMDLCFDIPASGAQQGDLRSSYMRGDSTASLQLTDLEDIYFRENISQRGAPKTPHNANRCGGWSALNKRDSSHERTTPSVTHDHSYGERPAKRSRSSCCSGNRQGNQVQGSWTFPTNSNLNQQTFNQTARGA